MNLDELKSQIEIPELNFKVDGEKDIFNDVNEKYNNDIMIYNPDVKLDKEIGDYEKALDYLEKGLIISRKIGNVWSISNCLSKIGELYIDLENYNKALQYISKGHLLKTEIGDKQSLGTDFLSLGLIYSKLNQISESITFYYRA